MKLYSCRVRLHGNVLHEVKKTEVSAAEIKILRFLHGSDAVLDVTETGKANRTEAEERARLSEIYTAYSEVEGMSSTPTSLVDKLFGPMRRSVLDDEESADMESFADDEGAEKEEKPAKAGSLPRKHPNIKLNKAAGAAA